MKTNSESRGPESDGIKIVMIEDVPAEVELVERELRNGGMQFSMRVVDSRDAFVRELREGTPHLILSDHGLPSFDGFAALAITRDRCPDVPFIFVSGHLGEECVITAFESGAADCVLKHRLSRLAPAVRRALHEAEDRRGRRIAEAGREQALLELRGVAAKAISGPPMRLLPICAQCKKIRDADGAWHTLEAYFRRLFNLEFTHGLCPGCLPAFLPGHERSA